MGWHTNRQKTANRSKEYSWNIQTPKWTKRLVDLILWIWMIKIIFSINWKSTRETELIEFGPLISYIAKIYNILCTQNPFVCWIKHLFPWKPPRRSFVVFSESIHSTTFWIDDNRLSVSRLHYVVCYISWANLITHVTGLFYKYDFSGIMACISLEKIRLLLWKYEFFFNYAIDGYWGEIDQHLACYLASLSVIFVGQTLLIS